MDWSLPLDEVREPRPQRWCDTWAWWRFGPQGTWAWKNILVRLHVEAGASEGMARKLTSRATNPAMEHYQGMGEG